MTTARRRVPNAATKGGDADIAAVAALFGDSTRATMLLALGAGEPLAAGELARRAGVSPSTASSHLAKLVAGGLVDVELKGRARLYDVHSAEVMRAVEALAAIAGIRPARTLTEYDAACATRNARMCYDHLAGVLGVGLFDALVTRAALHPVAVPRNARNVRNGLGDVALGRAADAVLARLGVDVAAVREAAHRRRQFAAACLDWTEARPHLGGALGAALCASFLERRWVRRRTNTRAVTVTDLGREELARVLGYVAQKRQLT